jgi:hypothetical protein
MDFGRTGGRDLMHSHTPDITDMSSRAETQLT